ncbi:MAG: hypothetical protein AAF921_18360 [Cyanobacteria bacterium P01_D01_bin.44]
MAFAQGRARWQRLMQQSGASDNLDTFEQLMSAYDEPHRFYHTAEHIAACLQAFDRVRDLAKFPAEVELALWFHDAVYDVRSSTNELDSAQWAVQFLKNAGGQSRAWWEEPSTQDGGDGEDEGDGGVDFLAISPQRVYDHVLATAHLVSSADLSGDSALVVNTDLTILGLPPAIYDQFEANIRREYQHVPIDRYRQKRREVLEYFLQQPEIFSIAYFRDRYEAVARRNLAGAIAALS